MSRNIREHAEGKHGSWIDIQIRQMWIIMISNQIIETKLLRLITYNCQTGRSEIFSVFNLLNRDWILSTFVLFLLENLKYQVHVCSTSTFTCTWKVYLNTCTKYKCTWIRLLDTSLVFPVLIIHEDVVRWNVSVKFHCYSVKIIVPERTIFFPE